MTEVELGTTYSLNQTAFQHIEPPAEPILRQELKHCAEWASLTQQKYYMLLCRELNDYTIFYMEHEKLFELTEEIKEVLESRGVILEIAFSHASNFFECWVRRDNGQVNMYAFFPCDDWVVVV